MSGLLVKDSRFGFRPGVLALVVACGVSGGFVRADVTTATKDGVTSQADTLTPEQEAAAVVSAARAAEDASTYTILLLGDKVSVENPGSAKGPLPDLAGFTTATLGGKVIDKTRPGAVAASVAEEVDGLLSAKPNVVIVFSGFADAKAETSDDAQQAALGKIIKSGKAVGARVILVPSSTEVGAMVSANMRLAASNLGASFVPMGTEVSGRPFDEAFEGIREELVGAEPETAEAVSEAGKAVTISGRKIQAPDSAPVVEGDAYQAQKATLRQELDRVAGEADAPAGATASDEKVYVDTGTTGTHTGYPDGGTLTKRGADAQESINMRPLPAVKAYRPQIPVPRNEINKKAPGLSR